MYYVIIDNKILTSEKKEILERFYNNVFELPEDYEEDKYKAQDGILVLNPNYEQEKAQKEKERVMTLKMTPRDFLLSVVEMGADWVKLKDLMAKNPRLEIELNYCKDVYRGNPLLDEFCGEFNITPAQLDELFISKGM